MSREPRRPTGRLRAPLGAAVGAVLTVAVLIAASLPAEAGTVFVAPFTGSVTHFSGHYASGCRSGAVGHPATFSLVTGLLRWAANTSARACKPWLGGYLGTSRVYFEGGETLYLPFTTGSAPANHVTSTWRVNYSAVLNFTIPSGTPCPTRNIAYNSTTTIVFGSCTIFAAVDVETTGDIIDATNATDVTFNWSFPLDLFDENQTSSGYMCGATGCTSYNGSSGPASVNQVASGSAIGWVNLSAPLVAGHQYYLEIHIEPFVESEVSGYPAGAARSSLDLWSGSYGVTLQSFGFY